MAKMGQRLNIIRKLFRKKEVNVNTCSVTREPVFDSKYKNIIKYPTTKYSYEMLDWINQNSVASVDVKFMFVYGGGHTDVYFGFEDESDALIFKIKYL